MIPRCPCGQVATHRVRVTFVAAGVTIPAPRAEGQVPEVRYGYYSAQHIETKAHIEREFARIGRQLVDYEIQELIS